MEMRFEIFGEMVCVTVSMCKLKIKIWMKYLKFGSDLPLDLKRIRVRRPSSGRWPPPPRVRQVVLSRLDMIICSCEVV